MDWDHLQREIDRLTEEDVCLAFSGGVDSSVLLKLLCDQAKKRANGGTVYAVTFHTRLHPPADLEAAQKTAAEIGAAHYVLYVDEWENQELLDNPVNRCYLCKKYLFTRLMEFGAERGIDRFIDGTNADDLKVYRPGLKALLELGIHSPLAESGVTKMEVRQIAKKLGLTVASRPSAPCLATRIPYGTRIDFQLLTRIDEAETFLKNSGFTEVRLRVHGEIARIEVPVDQFPKLTAMREQVIRRLKELGFSYITMDLEGFCSGSMDLHMKK